VFVQGIKLTLKKTTLNQKEKSSSLNYLTAGQTNGSVDALQCLHFFSGWVILYCEL